MTIADNIDVVQRYFEDVINGGNLALINELVAPDYIERTEFHAHQPGLDQLKQTIRQLHLQIPDLEVTIRGMVGIADTVDVFTITEGTPAHTAGGTRLRLIERHTLRVIEGRIVTHWNRNNRVLDHGNPLHEKFGQFIS